VRGFDFPGVRISFSGRPASRAGKLELLGLENPAAVKNGKLVGNRGARRSGFRPSGELPEPGSAGQG